MRDWIALASAHQLLGAVVSGRYVERPAHAWASKYAKTLFDGESRDGQLRRAVAAGGRVRTSQLDAVIQAAKKKALDPSDWHSVWAQLGEMAQSSARPLPLLGYVEGEGLKYTKDDAEGSTAFLSKDAFRMRMSYVSPARKRTRTKASEG